VIFLTFAHLLKIIVWLKITPKKKTVILAKLLYCGVEVHLAEPFSAT